MLAVNTDIEVYEKAVAEWKKCDVTVRCVKTMHDAIILLKENDNYLFIAIFEDSVPDFMTILPVMRDVTDIPIFVMSSTYTVAKNIKAMSLGADVYNPYHLETNHNVLYALELLKAQKRWANRPYRELDILICREITLSQSRRKVFLNDDEILLGKKEFDILCFLMKNSGYVVEHERLLREVWGEEYSEKGADVLWRTINRLKTKLKKNSKTHEYIRIDRKVGYVIDP
jgi:DNA-binding response OmpR family regulator